MRTVGVCGYACGTAESLPVPLPLRQAAPLFVLWGVAGV